MGAAPRPRRRRWWFALLAAAGTLLVLLVGAELMFRWFWRMPPAFAEFEQQGLYTALPGGGIGLTPGYRGSFQLGTEARVAVAVNSLGLRGPEPGAKQPGESRLLMVGDSLVFGYGVPAEAALPAQLQRALAGRERPTTVGNAGVPGAGSRDAAILLEHHAAAFGADAFLVAGYLGNDAVDDLRQDRAIAAGLKFDGPMARLVQESPRIALAIRSRAWLWFEAWVFQHHPTASPLLQMAPNPAELEALRGLPGAYPVFAGTAAGLFLDHHDLAFRFDPAAPPVLPRCLCELRRSLVRVRKAAAGRPVCFVVLPTLWQVDESRRQQRLRDELHVPPADYPRGTAAARWLAVAAELGIDAVDATPWLAAEPDPAAMFLVDQGHLSVAGNLRVAQALAEHLTSRATPGGLRTPADALAAIPALARGARATVAAGSTELPFVTRGALAAAAEQRLAEVLAAEVVRQTDLVEHGRAAPSGYAEQRQAALRQLGALASGRYWVVEGGREAVVGKLYPALASPSELAFALHTAPTDGGEPATVVFPLDQRPAALDAAAVAFWPHVALCLSWLARDQRAVLLGEPIARLALPHTVGDAGLDTRLGLLPKGATLTAELLLQLP